MTDIKQLEKAIHRLQDHITYCTPITEITHDSTFLETVLKAARAHLEALKQEPAGYSLVFYKEVGINFSTSFKERKKAEEYARRCDNVNPPDIIPLYTAPPPQEAAPDDLHIAYQQGRADERESLKGKCVPPFRKIGRPVYPISEDGE